MMAVEWYCRMAGGEMGPLTTSQLRALAAEGRLSPGDALRQGKAGPWVPAASVKGLFADKPASQESTASRPTSSSPGPAASASRPRPILRAVPMDDTPPALPKNPFKSRLVDEEDAGLDLSRMPADSPPRPPRPSKESLATGLDFLAEAPPVAMKRPVASVRPIGRRVKVRAEALRQWVLPALIGVLVFLLVVWIIVGQMRDSGTTGAASEAGMHVASASPGNADARKSDGGGQETNPTPKPASATAAPVGVKWIDAAREPWQCGDVSVKVRAASISRAKIVDAAKRVADTKDDYLLVWLEIANRSATRKIQYRSWNLQDDPPGLTDEHNNPYTLQTLRGGSVFEGQQRVASIYPEKAIEDLLVFERPIDRARTLRLRLPAGAFEGSGAGHIEISMSSVKSASGPTFRPPPPPPQ